MSISTLEDPRPPSAPHDPRSIPWFADHRFLAQAARALLLANFRYWTNVAPIVRTEIHRWQQHAHAIDDPQLRALALEKLSGEGFHAEAAAMLATRVPRSHRRDVVQAIIALELLFDYLDGLTELPSPDPLTDGTRLFLAYWDAIAPHDPDTPSRHADRPDGHYMQALSDTASSALARLPAASAVTRAALANAAIAIQAQVRMHAVPQLGLEQLETWARSTADGGNLQWREFLAGSASSVLVVHALIAAAADPDTTSLHAMQIQNAYLSTCTLLTLLDGLVDHDEDALDSRPTYIDLYPHPEELSDALSAAAWQAAYRARALRDGPHHVITLVGAIAYYTSHPGADSNLAAPIAKRLRQQVSPLIHPMLALMRSWRLAKRIRNRRTPSTGVLP